MDKGIGGWTMKVLVVDSLIARASNRVPSRQMFRIEKLVDVTPGGFRDVLWTLKNWIPRPAGDDAEEQGDGFKRRIEEGE
jgi:hypothetical protein